MQSKDSSRAVEEKSLKTYFESYIPGLASQFMKLYIKNSKFVFILQEHKSRTEATVSKKKEG